MSHVEIVAVGPQDVAVLAAIGRRTFIETFESGNDPEDFADYLEKAFAEAQLLGEIGAVGSHFFFARVDGEVAGYLKLNMDEAQTEKVAGRTLEIERIYVDGAFQGAGVGKALFDFALGIARDEGIEAIWLGVWEDNPKAIRFYERQGFEPFGVHSFTIGKDVQRDIMMRLELERPSAPH
ncbi:GNAT family N-acetyltransferase [Sphingomicrobium lutaoense]|uniref:Ribosomal protein S18 acetylase RimI-like enzyme n=1 Tax=Sphingomicrobium lutaoense TaxID=515949 RepID=A0A839Z3U4_9SPHN|nr:GNAT family N-acetyltransferase [Sphingomicrobium lutaoense]MBB3763264.1 ribosomal protein S18 acetylase RimI-like enzyme [Sphingomicrobium lutaoense]